MTVVIVLAQCDPATTVEPGGCTEQWSTPREDAVIAGVQAGVEWWSAAEPRAGLTFTYVERRNALTIYEPILHSYWWHHVWIEDILTRWGYTDDHGQPIQERRTAEKEFDFANDVRAETGTDWVAIAYVADDLNDVDNRFTDGYFAFAYLGGPRFVMTYDNDGWGIERMDSVAAHEFGHVFWAQDQYYQADANPTWCQWRSGYHYAPNENRRLATGQCLSNVSSIMRGASITGPGTPLDAYARLQVGWRDSDGDNILDVQDTDPETTLGLHTDSPGITRKYPGQARETAWPTEHPFHGVFRSITVNRLGSVEYRVDAGPWQPATPVDGAYDFAHEDFEFEIPLPAGEYCVEARAISGTTGNVDPTPARRCHYQYQATDGMEVSGGADWTFYDAVELWVDIPSGQWMRFRNDGEPWSVWEPYAGEKWPWLLTPGLGGKQVWFDVIDAAGDSYQGVDPIILKYVADDAVLTSVNRAADPDAFATATNVRLHAAPDGQFIQAAWEEWNYRAVPSYQAVFWRHSPDGGTTWCSPIQLSADGVTARNPDLDGANVVWEQSDGVAFRSLVIGFGIGGGCGPVALGSIVLLAQGTDPAIAVGPPCAGVSPVRHVVYVSSSGGVGYRRHTGSSWDPEIFLTADATARSPEVAAAGVYVQTAWSGQPGAQRDVYHRRGLDCGSDWTELPAILSSSVAASHDRPRLTAFPGAPGKVVAAWEAFAFPEFEAYYSLNQQDGQVGFWPLSPASLALTPPAGVSTSSLRPTVALTPMGRLHASWTEYRRGHYEVHYARHPQYGDTQVAPWSHYGPVSFGGYPQVDSFVSDTVAAEDVLGRATVFTAWSKRSAYGYDVRLKRDATEVDVDRRGLGPDPSSVWQLTAERTLDCPGGVCPSVARTYQYEMDLLAGQLFYGDAAKPWMEHSVQKAPGGTRVEVRYTLSVPHAKGHDAGAGTTYDLRICLRAPAYDEDDFGASWRVLPSGTFVPIPQMNVGPSYGTDACWSEPLPAGQIGHHGLIEVKVESLRNVPDTGLADNVIVRTDEGLEGLTGTMWLRAIFPPEAETDLRLAWTPIPPEDAARYDLFMAGGVHDSFYEKVDSVPRGTASWIAQGAAITGYPEVVYSGSAYRRYPANAFFVVAARFDDGSLSVLDKERVGRFTAELPAERVLLSVPFVPAITALTEVLGGIEGHFWKVSHYDAATRTWKTWVAGRPSNSLNNLDETLGFWANLDEDANGPYLGHLMTVGKIPEFTNIPLYASESAPDNHVGYPRLTALHHSPFGPLTVSEALQWLPWVAVEAYNPNAPPYYLRRLSPDDDIVPGYGYWFQMSDAALWTMVNVMLHLELA